MKRIIVFLSLFFVLSYSVAENWIGQAATYQLLPGAVTASGQKFSPESLSAASNGFKIGAEVEVTNAVTGKSIVVVINDRIVNDSKYFILLTPTAAKAIGLQWESGLVVVSADFNALNTTDRLPIGGLLPEDESSEKYRYFPEIDWGEEVVEEPADALVVIEEDLLVPERESETKQEKVVAQDDEPRTKIAPDMLVGAHSPNNEEELMLPPEDVVLARIGHDELVSSYSPNVAPEDVVLARIGHDELVSSYSPNAAPEDVVLARIGHDELVSSYSPNAAPEDVVLARIGADELVSSYSPNAAPEEVVLSHIGADELVETLEPEKPVSELVVARIFDDTLVDERSPIAKPKENLFDTIPWVDMIEQDSIYIKIFSSTREEEFARKYFNIKNIFKDLQAVKRGANLHLISGKIESKNLDAILKRYRGFGFRDAYVIYGRSL